MKQIEKLCKEAKLKEDKANSMMNGDSPDSPNQNSTMDQTVVKAKTTAAQNNATECKDNPNPVVDMQDSNFKVPSKSVRSSRKANLNKPAASTKAHSDQAEQE